MKDLRYLLVLGLMVLGAARPSGGSAQTTVFLGGAAALPLGDFGAITELGYQGHAGGTVEVGATGFALGVTGYFGSNLHKTAGDRSDIYGASALAGYTVAAAYALELRAWVGLGGMVHATKSDRFPGLNASKRGLAGTVGATVERSMGRVGLFLSGFYTRGLGKLGSSSFPTEFVTLGGGLSIPLGDD